MSQALKQLRALIARRPVTVTGRIVEVTTSGFKVQTRKGTVVATNGTPNTFTTGSYVLIKDSVIVGRSRDPAKLPKYDL